MVGKVSLRNKCINVFNLWKLIIRDSEGNPASIILDYKEWNQCFFDCKVILYFCSFFMPSILYNGTEVILETVSTHFYKKSETIY